MGGTRMGRRTLFRATSCIAGSVGAAVFALAMTMKPAAAATTSADYVFEFSPFGGSGTASCTVHVQADFPFGSANSARGLTSVSGANPACTSNVSTTVGAEYRATNDDFVTRPYNVSYGTSVSHTWTDVKRDFTSYHQVFFPACGCATQVYTLTTPNP